jgi:long-chain acyl-CoA synthetase
VTNEALPPAVAALIGPGGPYELMDYAAQDTTFKFFKTAPQNLRAIYRSSLTHAATFYVYEQERYTFAETWQQAARVAARLLELGVKKGDRVGIAMRNYPEWVFSFMGITSIGAVAVALNAWWSREELTYGIEDSGLRVIVVDGERLVRIDPKHSGLTVVVARCSEREWESAPVQALPWRDFLPPGEVTMPEVSIGLEDDATLFYTSGSTAHPKGVLSTHRAVIAAVMGFEAGAMIGLAMAGEPPAPLPYQPSGILTVPLFHTTGLVVQFLSCFRSGRKLVGMYKWDAEEALTIIERERITSFNGVPTMSWELVQSPNFHKYDLSSLKSMGGGGAAMAPQHARQIQERLKGGVPGTGYGMTETNALATSIAGAVLAGRPRSCGRAIPPLVQIKIVDENGNELPRGETGEIWIKGANVFKEYWNKPEDTARTLTDGWVHSGDIGHMDTEGFVFITDREKDMVIRGGENIGCQEVEAVIWDHPAVSEVAVFGVPDERLGEQLAAVIMPKPGQAVSEDEIKRHVAAHLARFKVPEYIWFRQEQLPRIASGKIYKRGLREEAIRSLGAQPS